MCFFFSVANPLRDVFALSVRLKGNLVRTISAAFKPMASELNGPLLPNSLSQLSIWKIKNGPDWHLVGSDESHAKVKMLLSHSFKQTDDLLCGAELHLMGTNSG